MTIRELVNIDMAITAHLRIYLDEMYDNYTYKNAPVYNDFFSKSKLASEYRSQQYFLRDVAMRRLDPDVKDGLEYWVSVHPTLQQSMMCVFAKLFATLNIAGFDDNAAFPLI